MVRTPSCCLALPKGVKTKRHPKTSPSSKLRLTISKVIPIIPRSATTPSSLKLVNTSLLAHALVISNRHVKLIDDTTISLTIRGPKINTVSSVPLSLSDGILLLRDDEAAVYTYIAEHTRARAVRYKSLDCLMTAEENYYFNSINYCSV